MAVFVYRARDSGGALVSGRADADSENDLIARLRNQGFLILEVEKDRDIGTLMTQPGGLLTRRITGKDLAVFARQFSTMVGAGLPVVTALRVLSRQATNRRLQAALTQVAVDVEAGDSLQTAFARQGDAFPVVMIQMIGAGEVGGILDEVLKRLADQLEKEENLRQKVRSAMVYPTIVSCVAVLVVIFLMIAVVPRFVEVYADLGDELPFATNLLIATSRLVQKTWWLMAGLGVLIAAWLKFWVKTEEGASARDRLLIRLPIFGPMISKQATARFTRILGGLLSSGINILKALAVVERVVGNRVVSAAVKVATEDVRQGQNLEVGLRRSNVFSPMVLEMVSIGEETGTLEEMLAKVADFYEEEVQRTAERLSASLEPLIIVGLALTVGFIVISMMLPIFNLWTTFSG